MASSFAGPMMSLAETMFVQRLEMVETSYLEVQMRRDGVFVLGVSVGDDMETVAYYLVEFLVWALSKQIQDYCKF
jgi:hypothetical protein